MPDNPSFYADLSKANVGLEEIERIARDGNGYVSEFENGIAAIKATGTPFAINGLATRISATGAQVGTTPISILKDLLTVEHAREDEKLAGFAKENDPITTATREIANKNPRTYLPPNTDWETGKPDRSMTLIYDRPTDATKAFDVSGPVYARNSSAPTLQLAEIIKLYDPDAAVVLPTVWGMAAFNTVLQTLNEKKPIKAELPAWLSPVRPLWNRAKRFLENRKTYPHIVASNAMFGGCKVLLNRYANVTFVDGTDLKQWKKALRHDTAAVFIENPGNPTGDYNNLRAIADMVHAKNPKTLVCADTSLNVAGQRPHTDGRIDVVFSSITKQFGFSEANGGFVSMSHEGIKRHRRQLGVPEDSNVNHIADHVAYMGATQAPLVARELIRHAPHLYARVKQQGDSAEQLALFLREPQHRVSVMHPKLDNPDAKLENTSVFAINVYSQARAYALIEELKKYGIHQNNNFGGPRTAITYPATTTHHSLDPQQQKDQGITPGLLRITVGIENVDVLKRIFAAALKAIDARPEVSPKLYNPALAA